MSSKYTRFTDPAEELEDGLAEACMILCQQNKLDPHQVVNVLVPQAPLVPSDNNEPPYLSDVMCLPAVHRPQMFVKQYVWEQFIPEVRRFRQLFQACYMSGLLK